MIELYLLLISMFMPIVTAVTGYIPADIDLHNPQNVQELQSFLAQDDTNSHLFLKAGVNGEIVFNGSCEDKAFQLQKNARDEGLLIDTEILTKSECIKYREYLSVGIDEILKLKENDGHFICKAVIGNEVYFIEPSNDKIWMAYYLD